MSKVDPSDIANPDDTALYIPFDTLAEILKIKKQDQRDALGALLTDFSETGDDEDIVEEKGARFVRWNIIWNASEFSNPGENKIADAIYEARAELEGAAEPLEELVAMLKQDEAPKGRSAGRAAGRSSGRSAAAAADAGQSRLNAALEGVDEPTDSDPQATTEDAKPARRRRTTKPAEEPTPEEAASGADAKPARRRRAAKEEEEPEAPPSTAGMNLDRIARENNAASAVSTLDYLKMREGVLAAELGIVRALIAGGL